MSNESWILAPDSTFYDSAFCYNEDDMEMSRIYLRQYIVLVVLLKFRYSMSGDHCMGLKTTLGTNIRRQRKERNLSQQKLAVYVDISITHLRAIEHGTTNTTVDVIERFAKFFGVEPYTLFIDSIAETKSAKRGFDNMRPTSQNSSSPTKSRFPKKDEAYASSFFSGRPCRL